MSSTLSRLEKEKQKLIQEKCQALLSTMLRDEDNKYCVDCDAKGPRWASWNLGIFLCIRCAGIHRNLGVHISRVKSVNLDSWQPEQVARLQQMGNSRARAVYEANLPDSFRRPQTDSALEAFVRAKYEQKKYVAKEWVPSPPPKCDWDKEIEEMIRRKEGGKKGSGGSGSPIPAAIPKPKGSSSSGVLPGPLGTPPGKPKVRDKEAPRIDLLSLEVSPAPATSASGNVSGSSLDVGGDDPFGAFVGSDTVQEAAPHPPSSSTPPVQKKSSEEEDFFNQPAAPSLSSAVDPSQKLTKDSILALYNQSQPQSQPQQFYAATNPYPNPYYNQPGGAYPMAQYQQQMAAMSISGQPSSIDLGMMGVGAAMPVAPAMGGLMGGMPSGYVGGSGPQSLPMAQSMPQQMQPQFGQVQFQQANGHTLSTNLWQ